MVVTGMQELLRGGKVWREDHADLWERIRQALDEGQAEEDLNAWYTLVHLRLLFGRQLPKGGEQCCVPDGFTSTLKKSF